MKSFRNSIFASLAATAMLLSSFGFAIAKPDEGMYTPDQIASLPLAARGLKIKASDIYNPQGGGLSEAIIRLSIGCSAEFVSPQGLILTNHHCGYDALVAASTPEKNYGEVGYKADSQAQELPAKGYSIDIPERTEEVTAQVTKGTEGLAGDALNQAIQKNAAALQAAEQAKAPTGSKVEIQPVDNGYFYYLYQTHTIKDIRIVYAPPKNIGFYGGDPDNFEWTRHDGDFTFMRAYVAPDGTAADYSASNVPYKPKKYLTLNIGPKNEGDFVFVLGYPGGTTRYRESQNIEFAQNINFPFIVDFLSTQSNSLQQIGREDEEKRIKLQAEVFELNNSIKAFAGGVEAMKRAHVVDQRKAEEAKFAAWVAADPARKQKYGNVLGDFDRLYKSYYATSARDRLLRTIPGVNTPIAQAPMPVFKELVDAVAAVQAKKAPSDAKKGEIQEVYKDRESFVERELIRYFLQAIANLTADQKFAAAESIFGNQTGRARRQAEEAFAESIAEKDFGTADSVVALYSLTPEQFQQKYPAIWQFAAALTAEQPLIAQRLGKFNAEIGPLRVQYMRGMSEMRGVTPYPDANFTQRFTFGNIKGYSPREAVQYSPFTTLKGVLEKDTGIEPFNAPPKLRELQNAHDFGRYGVGDSVPVDFLATLDIIGGNSGSPVMNGYGEQVGIVFDGNYEGLGNDYFFSPDYGRTIAVDIRYVLFLTEKFGGAGWILNELTIKGAAKGKTAMN
jgi:Peptidase S46